MQSEYEVYDLTHARSSKDAVEYMGSKRKGWLTYRFNDNETRILYKLGRPGTGENWAEKVTCELAELLGLPHALYHLARLSNGEACVISPSFLEMGDEIKFGNQLIEGFDNEHKFKNTQHTITAILTALEVNQAKLPRGTSENNGLITNAKDFFIGYLCFDAWIGNTDRHAENWGIITDANNINLLAPTFDHASSLGRNESDDRRIERLKTRDKGFNVNAYVQRAIMPIYDSNGQALTLKSLVQECKNINAESTDYWISKITKVMSVDEKIKEIFDRIPDDFISEPAKSFAMAILTENVKGLSEI